MANMISKIKCPKRKSHRHASMNEQQEGQLINKRTVFDIWRQSNKTVADLIQLMNSQESSAQNHQTVLSYVSLINEREKLQSYLWEIQIFLLDVRDKGWENWTKNFPSHEACTLNNVQKSEIFQQIHSKYSNIWFISQKNKKSGLQTVHEKQLQQLHSNKNFSEKLCQLYLSSLFLPKQQISNQIRMASLTNAPLLITPQTIQFFFNTIIEEEICIIDQENNFMKFITELMIWGQLQANQSINELIQQYNEKSMALLDCQQWLHKDAMMQYLKDLRDRKEAPQDNWIIHCMIRMGKQFLRVGNPHSCGLIFKCAINTGFKKFGEQQVRMYFYTRVYETFLYSLDSFIGLKFFEQLYKMEIRDIIHFLLTDNEPKNLNILHNIFVEISNIGNKDHWNFEIQLQNYIFSKYCNLQLCTKIIKETGHIKFQNNAYECHYKFISKLKESKFDIIISDVQSLRPLIESIAKNHVKSDPKNAPVISLQHFDRIIDIINLLFIMGINDKTNDIWIFFESDFQSYQFYHSSRQYLQEKALYFLKAVISKYFINSHKDKKITLENKSKDPKTVDLGNTQSLFEVCHYLHSKIFGMVINRTVDIHQIIFQHMLYFYKYEQLKALVSSKQFLNRFQVEYQMLQILIIENINKQLIKNEYKKIYKDIPIQLKLLKNKTVERQSIISLYNIIKYLSEDFSIELDQKLKDNVTINLLYFLVDQYPEKIQSINFDQIYEDIRVHQLTALEQNNSLIDVSESQAYLMTNQLLLFKSVLANKAFELNKRKFGNQLIDEINGFHPPWITSKLIDIFQKDQAKIPINDRLFGVAVNSCVRGKDLKYLLKLWRKKNMASREKRFRLGQFLETARQYLIIDEQVIIDQEQYRNFIAEIKFSDQSLCHRNYQLFYILLGTEPQRAFHHAIMTKLDVIKMEIMMKEGMKQGVFNPFSIARLFFKTLYYFDRKITFRSFKQAKFNLQELQKLIQPQHIPQQIAHIYPKIHTAYTISQIITQQFIDIYLSQKLPPTKQLSITYQILFNHTNGKNMIINLIEYQMDTDDIKLYDRICNQGYQINNLIELCLFRLENKANTSDQLNAEMINILAKISMLSNSRETMEKILKKMVEKIFSIKMLVQILEYLRKNSLFRNIVSDDHLKVIHALANVEQGQEFSGLIPYQFLEKPLGFYHLESIEKTKESKITQEHQKIIKNCRKKTNIFVLSKAVSFFYGMNKNIEVQLLEEYMNSKEADEEIKNIWSQIQQKQMNK